MNELLLFFFRYLNKSRDKNLILMDSYALLCLFIFLNFVVGYLLLLVFVDLYVYKVLEIICHLADPIYWINGLFGTRY